VMEQESSVWSMCSKPRNEKSQGWVAVAVPNTADNNNQNLYRRSGEWSSAVISYICPDCGSPISYSSSIQPIINCFPVGSNFDFIGSMRERRRIGGTMGVTLVGAGGGGSGAYSGINP